MKFFLGTHEPHWLTSMDVPLFISRRRLARKNLLGRATCGSWGLDSGGFTELNLYGKWQTSPEQYADEAQAWQAELGGMEFAAIQDHMCEDVVLKKTGKTVQDHQGLSLESYLRLRELAPGVPWAPVLQGQTVHQYLRHVAWYRDAGVDLAAAPVVGVGTMCRRQASDEAAEILLELQRVGDALGFGLHAFGLKELGLKVARRYGVKLQSADSLAWSYSARRGARHPDCTHAKCNNCRYYAAWWRERLLERTS